MLFFSLQEKNVIRAYQVFVLVCTLEAIRPKLILFNPRSAKKTMPNAQQKGDTIKARVYDFEKNK